MTTPLVQPAVIIVDADFIKSNITTVIDALIDTTKDAAKPLLTNAAEKTIPVATTYAGNFIKNNVTTKVSPSAKPIVDACVDTSTKKSEDMGKQAVPLLVDRSLETTADLSKKASKKGVDSSVDSTSSLSSNVYKYFTTK